jgi:hypothetical protein
LEAEVWESVRAILSDPERLRDDLDAMIEMKRRVSRNDPTEEMNLPTPTRSGRSTSVPTLRTL